MKVWALAGNEQKLDGGAMFGHVPRAVWENWYSPDDQGRITLACRAFLVETDGRKILLETGIGAFFPPSLRERYGIHQDRHILLDSLAKLGLCHDDIDVVVLSHLHFDHAGGLLSAYEEGKQSTLLFPKAHYLVGRRALERARSPHDRDRASYIPELVPALDASGRLVVLEDHINQHPALGEQICFELSHGHTPGMLHTWLLGKSTQIFFAADMIPGSPWIHLPVTMGYDRSAELVVDEKSRILATCTDQNRWLAFTHDPNFAFASVTNDETGKYRIANSRVESTIPWDLDEAPNPTQE